MSDRGDHLHAIWHHLVGVRDSGSLYIYIDGVLEGSASNNYAQDFDGYWRIGSYKGDNWPNTGDGYFSGAVDDVRIYERALTDGEVASMYGSR